MVSTLVVFAVCCGSNFFSGFAQSIYDLESLEKNLSLESDVMIQILCPIAQASNVVPKSCRFCFFSPTFRKNCFNLHAASVFFVVPIME